MNTNTSTITITFGDQAENHVGMQVIGNRVNEGLGFQLPDIEEIVGRWEELGAVCELYDLGEKGNIDGEEAYVLVIRDALAIIGIDPSDLFKEQMSLDYDKKAFMYGRVVQKKARWNLCFGDESQEPDYESKKGRIVSWKQIPLLDGFKNRMTELFGEKARDLYGESNYYYDIRKCGIGFHGDSERRKVIAIRLGAAMSIHYRWYCQNKPVGEPIEIELGDGDLYIMSEKAVGTDWKKRNGYTLRHAAGCRSFTDAK